MKRILCLLLVLVMMCSLCVQAFADGDVLYCRMCGKKIPADSRVCSYCGETVVHVDEDAAVKTLGSESSVTQTPAAPSAAPAPAAPSVASPAASTDVKTALSQSSAPSPATQASTAVPGPFNTTLGTSGSPGHVRVTKSPTSESVPYGGSCSFIAHAANATSVTWYIANSDAAARCRPASPVKAVLFIRSPPGSGLISRLFSSPAATGDFGIGSTTVTGAIPIMAVPGGSRLIRGMMPPILPM